MSADAPHLPKGATNIAITPAFASKAKELLEKRLHTWIMSLIAIPGYAEWKNDKLKEQLMFSVDPDHNFPDGDDFVFTKEIMDQHTLITGYYNVLTAMMTVRQTELYFRRYPFRNREVSREDHLKTCCELLFSRVYHFRERFFTHLTKLDRATEPRKSLDLLALRHSFEAHFKQVLDQRRIINHETGYSDIELGSIGLNDMLSDADAEFAAFRTTQHVYRTVSGNWARKTRAIADDLDLYVGYAAAQMLLRCSFLEDQEAAIKSLRSSGNTCTTKARPVF